MSDMETPSNSDGVETKLVEDAKYAYRIPEASFRLRSEPYDLERFKAKLKSEFGDSLDYSLLEDEVMPEFCESSPDFETRCERVLSTGVSALLRDLTLAETPRWQDEISDESFVRTEEMVKRLENVEPTPERSVDDTNEFVSFDDSKTSPRNSKIPPAKRDNPYQTDRANDTLEFNDTIEEMDHFLKQARAERLETIPTVNVVKNDRFVTPVLSSKPSVQSKTEPRRMLRNESKAGNDRFKINAAPQTDVKDRFRVLTKSNPALNRLKPPDIDENAYGRFRVVDGRSTLRSVNNIDRYRNVASPIRCYINNSPTVPLVQNASPKKNYWDKVQSKNPYRQTTSLKKVHGKENIRLPEIAYKSSKVTNMVEKTSIKHLPKHHNKVVSVAQNLPKPLVIKHLKREKEYTPKQIIDGVPIKSHNLDSFVHLPNVSMDISHCIGKQAYRTRTLK